MAKRAHVKIVEQGAKTILKWREAHLGERLDLAEADFSGADLRGGGPRLA
jgi:hypothetical protein